MGSGCGLTSQHHNFWFIISLDYELNRHIRKAATTLYRQDVFLFDFIFIKFFCNNNFPPNKVQPSLPKCRVIVLLFIYNHLYPANLYQNVMAQLTFSENWILNVFIWIKETQHSPMSEEWCYKGITFLGGRNHMRRERAESLPLPWCIAWWPFPLA